MGHRTNEGIADAVESAPDSNTFTDADATKLAGVSAGAEVNPDVVPQAEAEAGTATTERTWTAQRVAQAIAALATGAVTSVFGRTGAVTAQSGDYNADEITETATNKILTSAERTKLAGIETAADVTDTANVTSALELDYNDSEGTSTTSSGTPQTKVAITLPAITGTVVVFFAANIYTASSEKRVAARLYNSTDATVLNGPIDPWEKNANSEAVYSGFEEIVLTGSAKTIQLQYYSPDGVTVGINHAKLMVIRIA